jgi:hypothetical protein
VVTLECLVGAYAFELWNLILRSKSVFLPSLSPAQNSTGRFGAVLMIPVGIRPEPLVWSNNLVESSAVIIVMVAVSDLNSKTDQCRTTPKRGNPRITYTGSACLVL